MKGAPLNAAMLSARTGIPQSTLRQILNAHVLAGHVHRVAPPFRVRGARGPAPCWYAMKPAPATRTKADAITMRASDAH